MTTSTTSTDIPPYLCDTLPVEERISDLLSRMTIQEKTRQLDMYMGSGLVDQMLSMTQMAPDGQFLPERAQVSWGDAGVGSIHDLYPSHAGIANAIQTWLRKHSRLWIPVLFIEEALHGFSRSESTVFPQAIALASTWNSVLLQRVGAAIAAEMRAVGVHLSLSPVLCLAREPRWGRVEETYGEDPYLAGQLGLAYVTGMQGESLATDHTVIAEPKHFAGHGSPEGGINQGPVHAGVREMRELYLQSFAPAFREGGAFAAMCAYHEVDGLPCAANHWLLTQVLREEWGFKGLVIADLGAIRQLQVKHCVATDAKDAICQAMEAGLDMQFYDYDHETFQGAIEEAILEGRLQSEILDRAVSRVLRAKFLLGLFDDPLIDLQVNAHVQRCASHLSLSHDAAREAICLLKNDHGLLPLSKTLTHLAVIGPSAAVARLGDYSGVGDGHPRSLLQGIQALAPPSTVVTYVKGTDIDAGDLTPIPSAWYRTPDGTNQGLVGKYYPGPSFQEPCHLIRVDALIDFNWAIASPAEGMPVDRFSVRWQGRLIPEISCRGHLGLVSQDAMRVWIDDELLLDGWTSTATSGISTPFTFLAGKDYQVRVEYEKRGAGSVVLLGWSEGDDGLADAVMAAQQADVAILALGESDKTSGEGLDRASLDLPGQQMALLEAVCATGTPVVLILQNGRPLTINWAAEHVPAIIEAWFPGEFGGLAMAEVLFGEYNPAGRLPVTFPRSVGQLPVYYNYKPSCQGRYVDQDRTPLFPFGHGLSYTTFTYANLRITPLIAQIVDTITVQVEVTNTGLRAGDEVVQLYIHDVVSSVTTPVKSLKGFTRVHLQAGKTTTVTFQLTPEQLAIVDRTGQWTVEPGEFEIIVGGNSDGAVQGTLTLEKNHATAI